MDQIMTLNTGTSSVKFWFIFTLKTFIKNVAIHVQVKRFNIFLCNISEAYKVQEIILPLCENKEGMLSGQRMDWSLSRCLLK